MISATLLGLSIAQSQNLSYRERFPLPDATVPSGWGVNIHFTDPQPGEMEKMAALGIKWVRMDLFWSHVEKEKGKYDFSGYDRLMGHLKKHQIRPLFILDYGNDLYEKGAPKTDTAQAAFVKFARQAVERYKGQGVLWEMWNEPNLPMFWQPEPNVELYSKLAVSVGKMIREVAPQEWYIGPATSGFDWAFLEGTFARGVLKYFDAVSVHPYRQTQPETSLEDWQKLRTLTAKYSGGRTLPLLSGEWGYSDIWKGQTPQLKADYVARQYLSNLAAGVNLSIYYDWKNDGTDPKEPEHHFGILGHDLSDKPASNLLSFFAKELKGFKFAADVSRDILPSEGDEARILIFTKGKEIRLAAWSQINQPFAARLPLSSGKGKLISHQGIQEVSYSTLKGITFTSTPMILVPDKVDALLKSLAMLPAKNQVYEVETESDARRLLGPWLDSLRAARSQDEIKVYGLGEDNLQFQIEARSVPNLPRTKEEQFKTVLDRVNSAYGIGGPVTFIASFEGKNTLSITRTLTLRPRTPLTIELGADSATLLLNNPKAWKGTLMLITQAGAKPLQVNGSLVQKLELQPKAGFRASVLLNGRIVAAQPWQKLVPLYDSAPQFTSYSEGDKPAQVSVIPDPSEPGTWIYSSTFPAGWSYSLIRAEPFPTLASKDGEVVSYGLEVEGDGSGNILRSRFVDAKGQVFQPNGVVIDWVGWRIVRFEVSTKDAGWWGGPADGVMHWPVKLDNLLLVDSAKRLAGTTKIRFRNFHKILHDPLVTKGGVVKLGTKIDP
jgi:hypothetical protein